MNPDLRNIKLERMVKEIVVNKKTQGEAFALASGRKKQLPGDAARASNVLKTPEAKQTIEEIKRMYRGLAIKGIQTQVDMLDDSLTPPSVKNDIAKHFQTMAELNPQKNPEVDARSVHFHGLTDKTSRKELLEKALKLLGD